jgi:hypothetical protein
MATFRDLHSGFVGVTRTSFPPGPEGSPVSWLSFPRVIDVPFEICVAAMESWQRTGRSGELRIGRALLRWPIEHGRDRGARQIEVRLAQGPLRPRVRMRLEVDRWSASSARTALELIPCQQVRPTAAYFRSGHLLLDSLTHSLRQHRPARPRRGLEVVGQLAEQG